MAYEIRNADGELVTIEDGSANSTPQYSIALVGRNTFNYGYYIAETQLHLLENFASTNKKPNFPTPGQLWYNKADKSLYINTGDDIHDYEAWVKVAQEGEMGSPSNPIDNIYVDNITSGTITGDTITGDTFNGGNFTGEDFTGNSFTGEEFHGGIYYGDAFYGPIIEGATHTGTTFNGTNFIGTNFTGTFSGNLTGKASSADKWSTSRTITLAGDTTGVISLDGSSNATLTITVLDDSHNHVIGNIDSLQEILNGMASEDHSHPGTIPAPIALGATEHLDNLKTPSVYYQPTNANAATGRGYPEANAGTLIVTTAAGPVQQYFVYNSSKVYVRAQYSTGAWTPWARQYNTEHKPTPAEIGALPSTGGTVSGSLTTTGRIIVTSLGDEYSSAGLEVRGNGTPNTIHPAIGFHQPGVYASSLQLTGNGDFRFYNQGLASYAKVSMGNFYASGNGDVNDVYARSDIRLKSDLVKIESAVEKVCQLTGYTYDKKQSLSATETQREAGLIAQHLQEVLPEAVSTSDVDELLTISSSGVNALLVEAIKELSQQNKQLLSMIDSLNSTVRRQQTELAELNDYITRGNTWL